MSDNDLSPAASFHGSQEDLFTSKGMVGVPSDTDDDFIEEDMPKSSSARICTNPPSPRTRSKVSYYCADILCYDTLACL